MRDIDFEITDHNGPKDIGGMIALAKRSFDEDIRTILCIDDSDNEAFVLLDDSGVVRVHETMRNGTPIASEIADAIRDGVPPSFALPNGVYRISAELTLDEKKLVDDGQGWWIDSDEVELSHCGGMNVALIVTRREGPEECPMDGTWDSIVPDGTRQYCFDSWIRIDDLPTSIVLRMLADGFTEEVVEGRPGRQRVKWVKVAEAEGGAE